MESFSQLRCQSRLTVRSLAGPHVLDDVESLLYLIEFLLTADLPWGWSTISEDTDIKQLKEERKSWVPENPSLQEFLTYARDRR